MRARVVIAGWACSLAACHSNPGPSLTIDPGSDGMIAVSAPTDFTATLTDSDADVTWAVTGGGSLSTNDGLHVVFTPPPGTGSETLTATAGTLSASVTITSSPEVLDGAIIPGLTAPVTVQYDAEDIPHINCAAAVDCVAVQGYLQARDRLFPMDFLRHVARANLAELIGVDGLSQDVEIRTLFLTRAGHRVEDDLVNAMDPTTSALLDAFVGGINAQLAERRAADPTAPLGGEYAQLPFPLTASDVADWTPQDTLALARLEQYQLSESLDEESSYGQFAAVYGPGAPLADPGKMTAWIRAAAPPTEQAHTLSPTAFAAVARPLAPSTAPRVTLAPWGGVLAQTHAKVAALTAALRPLGAAVGSNNWVVAGAKSATSVAMVANDPHLGLQYPPLFHLSVMTSSDPNDGLDLAGGAFPGVPGALVGRGAHVGWGVTVVGYDVTDLYLEQFLPEASCPGAALGVPCVLFKGVPTSTLPVPVTFKVRVGPGASGLVDASTLPNPPPPVLLVVPQHGPIIQAPDAAGHGVSVRWTGQEPNTQDLRAFYGLDTASDVDSAMAALEYYATGAQNFVLADDQGHIAYDPHALVPLRNFADARVVGANVIPPWFPLPGDGTAEWGDGTSNCADPAGAPASCWTADADLPHGKDPAKGYYFTANADPTYPSVSDDNNPLAHPPYLSFDWDDSSGFRATRIEQLLQAAIDNNQTVSLDDMEAIQSDHVSRMGKVFGDYVAALPASSDPDLTTARAILAQWAQDGYDCPSGLRGSDPVNSPVDATPAVVQSSTGCFLFHETSRILSQNVFADDLAVAGQGVDGLRSTKAMIYMMGLDPTTAAGQAGSKFCNDVDASGTTIATHSCAEQVETALVEAYDFLMAHVDADPSNWTWGRYHTIQPVPLLALVTTDYEPGPYARPGGYYTVDVGSPTGQGPGTDMGYASGGNVRHISLMDPAKPVVKMQLPGPERDVPDLNVGPDLLGQWVLNLYFDFAFGSQIDSVAVSTQTFSAQ
ncbi:MAG TPA: penicillin acylase family protein [Kofleriaceae bacterium]|nr:penicillin acylase family protein [Kofleriaceae bacterium]